MAIQEIYVTDFKNKIISDPTGDYSISAVTAKIYRFQGITEEEAERLRIEVLTDPLTQDSSLNPAILYDYPNQLEVGYLPGQTDPDELELLHSAQLVGINPIAAKSSVVYATSTPIPKEVKTILINKIQTVIESPPATLIYKNEPLAAQKIPVINLTVNELMALSKEHSLFLDETEMTAIQNHYYLLNREPTDVELETFAQTWSEHCSHKTFKAILVDEFGFEKKPLMERIKATSAKYWQQLGVVSAFSDNAGGMRFYEGLVIIGKGETHNSPVAIVPYAGALTKNGGLYRDILGTGKGGKNLLSLMINNYASPFTNQRDVKPGSLHPKNLLLENSRGEREYGNPMGIPTHGIDLHFHNDFGPKPTSLGVAIGIIPELSSERGTPKQGDLIITIGGKTGRDGIHGATFSSGSMDANTNSAHTGAVQLGDPIIEKTFSDAILAARDAGLIRAITDCGAGGYSSAIGEMADGIGALVFLDKIPTKYTGLTPRDKWISESQERMIVSISPKNWGSFRSLCQLYGTEATIIGRFTNDNRLKIYNDKELVGNIELDFLHHGRPQRRMQMKYTHYPEDLREPEVPKNFEENYKAVLSHLNICSKEEMHREYDQTVQGTTVLAPYCGVYKDVPNDGTVVAPIPNKAYGVVQAHAVNPILNKIDPYWGAVWAYALAATRYTAIGGNIRQSVGIDNFISPSPDPETLANLDLMTDGMDNVVNILQGGAPVSGKDSLSSTYIDPDGQVTKVPPSLNITIFGKTPDIEKTLTCDFKKIGSTICVVGELDANRMGGSVYFDTQGIVNSQIPRVDVDTLPDVLEEVRIGIRSGKIISAKAIGEGGIATALALMCFGGDCGAWIETTDIGARRADYAVFNETAGCVLVEIDEELDPEDIFPNAPYTIIGFTTREKTISFNSTEIEFLRANVDELKKAWQKPIKEMLNG